MWLHKRRHAGPPAAMFLVLLLSPPSDGCRGTSNRIAILMTPHGDSLQRRIAIERIQTHEDSLRSNKSPSLDQSVAGRLTAAYAVAPDTSTHLPYIAERRFATIPDDLGNRGYYHHYTSALGSSWSYDERLRGMDDPAAYVADRFALADSLAAPALAWLRFELVTQPEYPRVADYLERELRGIAHTLSLMPIVASAEESDSTDTLQWWASMEAEVHPLGILLYGSWSGFESDTYPLESELLRARDEMARRMGLTTPADKARVLGFLADPPSVAASFDRYCLAASKTTVLQSGAGELVDRLWESPSGIPKTDEIVVELALPVEPDEESTNGTWDEGAHRLRWHAWLPEPSQMAGSAPMVCHAAWSVPDSTLQRKLFGTVAIEADQLVVYNQWYCALDPARQAEWNRMLLGLRPGRLDALKRFRFAGEPKRAPAPGDSVAWSPADYPRNLIEQATRPPRKDAKAPNRPSRR